MSRTALSLSSLTVPAGAGDGTNDRILDAAMAQFVDFGIRRTTVEDVAVRAGLTRVTIHRRFGRKEDLVQAVMLRELSRFIADFQATIAPLPTLEEKLVEGFAFTLATGRNHPLITRVLATEPDVLLPEMTIRGGPFLAAAREFLVAFTRADAEGFDEEDVAGIADLFVRLVASFILTPSPQAPSDEAGTREYARRFLTPLLRTARRSERSKPSRSRR